MTALEIKFIDEWTDQDLKSYGTGAGPGMSISTAVTIWSLDSDMEYSGYDAARYRNCFTEKRVSTVGSNINSKKSRISLTGTRTTGRELKSMIIDQDDGKVIDGKARIRIELAPRLAAGLMVLARQAPKDRHLHLEKMRGMCGRIDRLKIGELRRLVWHLENQWIFERRKGDVDPPPIWFEISQLSSEELFEIVSYIGYDNSREVNRLAAQSIPRYETLGTADVIEPVIHAAGRVADTGRMVGREAKAAVGRVAERAGDFAEQTAARAREAPEKVRQTARNIAGFGKLRGLSPRARTLVFASCLVIALVGVGSASVMVQEPGLILHILKTKGPGAAVKVLPAYYLDSAGTHRDKFEFAWAHYRNHDFEKAEKGIRNLLSDNPSNYTQGSCFYLLGLINRQLGEHFQAVGSYSKAIKYYEGFPESVELVKIEKARSFTYLGLIDLAEELIEPIEGISLANQEKVLEIKANIALDKKEYSQALDFSKKRYVINLNEGNLLEAGYSLTHIGFYQTLLGQIDDAIHNSLKAQAIAIELGDKELGFFAQINWIAIRRCQGQEYLDLANHVESWSLSNNRPLVLEFLRRTLSLPCFSDT